MGWLVRRFVLVLVAAIAIWCVWIDYKIRRDFSALQWALPARLYARPVELYAGAHLSAADLTDTLQRLGYREANQVNEPGEYNANSSRVRLWTRGFSFWDGEEPSVYVDVDFLGRRVNSLRGNEATGELALARLPRLQERPRGLPLPRPQAGAGAFVLVRSRT